MSIVEIHAWLGKATLLCCLSLAVWGAMRFARRQGVSEGYWWGLVIAEMAVLTQGGLGAYLWYSGSRPAQGMHLLFGLVVGIVIPAIFVASRGRERRVEMLAYSVTVLAMAGLILGAVAMAG